MPDKWQEYIPLLYFARTTPYSITISYSASLSKLEHKPHEGRDLVPPMVQLALCSLEWPEPLVTVGVLLLGGGLFLGVHDGKQTVRELGVSHSALCFLFCLFPPKSLFWKKLLGPALEKLPDITMNFHMPVTHCQYLANLLFHRFSYGQHHDRYSLILLNSLEVTCGGCVPFCPWVPQHWPFRNRDIILHTHVVTEP